MNTPFLNRSDELTQVEALLKDRKLHSARFIHCETNPATGLTAFLKFSMSKFKGKCYSFYIDGNYKIANSLSSQILINLFNNYPSQVEKFKEDFLKKHPNDLRALGVAFFNLIPFGGSFIKDYLKESKDLKDVPQFQSTAYPSIIAELICPFLNQISKQKPVIIFIDNAQELDNWSLDILRSSISEEFNGLNYIMAFVNRNNENRNLIEELLWKVKSLGVKVDRLDFSMPHKDLVKEFYSYKGIPVSDSRAAKIIESSDGNIYKILTLINNGQEITEGRLELSNNQLEILRLLEAAYQPLRKSDIEILITTSDHLFVENLEQLEKDMTSLVEKGYISYSNLPDSDIIVSLNFSSNPYLKELISSSSNNLIQARNLYEYFLKVAEEKVRYSQTELALLLYRLAKIVDKANISKRAQAILSLSLKMGSAESAIRYVDKAVLSEPTYSLHDYFVKIAFHISVRDYRESLKLLIDPPQESWRALRVFRILLAISYNRCRMHTESENLIKDLISTCKYKAELSILLAYSISGYLHENKVDRAKEIFLSYKEQVKGAPNYGYFLRNGSTAFQADQTELILRMALTEFKKNEDWFGYYTTLCNLGKCECKLGRLKEADKNLEEAYDRLKTYGFHHLHIVLTNLGISKLLSGNGQEAEMYLNKSFLFSSNAMPKIYNQINLALVKLYQKRNTEAYDMLLSLKPEVDKFSFDRVKQKYYLNLSAAAYASNQESDSILGFLMISEQHPDRNSEKFTMERISLIRKNLTEKIKYSDEMFHYLSDFCYLEYWYQNPLELLPSEILP